VQKNFKVELIPRDPKNRDKLCESESTGYLPRGLPRVHTRDYFYLNEWKIINKPMVICSELFSVRFSLQLIKFVLVRNKHLNHFPELYYRFFDTNKGENRKPI
jgi:hypothetical protein